MEGRSAYELVLKLRRGQEIKCIICGKGQYVTKQGHEKTAWSFWCNSCNHLLHCEPAITVE